MTRSLISIAATGTRSASDFLESTAPAKRETPKIGEKFGGCGNILLIAAIKIIAEIVKKREFIIEGSPVSRF